MSHWLIVSLADWLFVTLTESFDWVIDWSIVWLVKLLLIVCFIDWLIDLFICFLVEFLLSNWFIYLFIHFLIDAFNCLTDGLLNGWSSHWLILGLSSSLINYLIAFFYWCVCIWVVAPLVFGVYACFVLLSLKQMESNCENEKRLLFLLLSP